MSDEVEERLYACLPSRRWAEIVAGRVFEVADDAMDQLTDAEWLAAISAHPRIGERGGDAPASSKQEQSAAMQSSMETLAAIAAENRRYEQKFGHVFLIFASGRSGAEILAELRRRMTNEPDAELLEAKGELRKIAHLRLQRMLAS